MKFNWIEELLLSRATRVRIEELESTLELREKQMLKAVDIANKYKDKNLELEAKISKLEKEYHSEINSIKNTLRNIK